jgi:CspA family cold shock protein
MKKVDNNIGGFIFIIIILIIIISYLIFYSGSLEGLPRKWRRWIQQNRSVLPWLELAKDSKKNIKENFQEKGSKSGIVRSFDISKRSGSIISDEGGRMVFVNSSNIKDGSRSLQQGDKVTFNVINGPNGYQATDVERV